MKVALAFLLAVSYVSAGPIISSSLEAILNEGNSANIMILMKSETAEVRKSIEQMNFINTDEKATSLVKALRSFTEESQKDVLQILSTLKADRVEGFYVSNRISAKGATKAVVDALRNREDIAEIREEKVFYLDAPAGVEEVGVQALEWGVENIKANLVWPTGITGKGVVVSNIDTGVRYTHSALASGFRADYGWFDPEEKTLVPTDTNGHGSHTMGSIAGRNGTGVAPGAEWIACRGCPGACPESALLGCGQWTLCPTKPDGSAPDCTKRPKISSNSWAGGNEDSFYNDVVASWTDVGIIPVFALGNSGPGCRSANSPGDQPGLISVGATDTANKVASFSSHGPSATALRIKPEVSAPGVNIRSCGYNGDNLYKLLSGTSMATPHVAGAIALLLEHTSTLTLADIAKALQDSALKPIMDQVLCTGGGVDPENPWPNNSYGHGKIDIEAAIKSLG